ncbi:MAG: flagellar filament capping protein FliD [Bdellovibrionota bacterium]
MPQGLGDLDKNHGVIDMPLINFSGIASGIDSSSLIEAILAQQRSALIEPKLKTKTTLEETNEALSELTNLLNDLNTTVSKFRLVNGGVVAKQAVSSDETKVAATASNSATTGSYTINVSQLASNGVLSFDDRFASGSSTINSSINNGASAADRTVNIAIGTGAQQENINIVLTNTSTAQDYVDSFNSQSTKATASLVNLGTESSPSYGILISSSSEGTELGTLSQTVGAEVQTAGTGAFTAATTDQATDAQFTIDGISGTITRGSNTVSDVIAGLSFNFQATGSAKVTVGVDAESTSSSVEEFVTAFNKIVQFVKENDAVTQGESDQEVTNIFGPLANVSVDENVITSLKSALVEAGISGGQVNVLADLGITTERDGTLKFDAEVFAEALTKDPSSVETITRNLGESLGAVDGRITSFTRFGGLIDAVENSNKSLITDIESRIQQVETRLLKEEESLTARFARLESLIGSMQAQQSAITSVLASIG